MHVKRDFYEVLARPKGASADELKKPIAPRPRNCTRTSNKDDPKAAEKFKEANEAYEVLKDAEKKAAYDQFWSCGVRRRHGRRRSAAAQADLSFRRAFSDVFDDLFGDFMGGQRRGGGGGRARARGSDLRYNLRVSIWKMPITGKETTIICPPAQSLAKAAMASGAEGGAEPADVPNLFRHGQSSRTAGFLYH